jgi:hypothetical protein
MGVSLFGASAKMLRLPAPQRRRLAEAVAELARASVEFRLAPSSKTVALLGPPRQDVEDEPVDREGLDEAVRVGHAVAAAAARLPWHPKCLPQALAVQRMLRRRGIAGSLHLGVTAASAAEAHAWVTVAGRPVIGRSGVERFVPLAAFR